MIAFTKVILGLIGFAAMGGGAWLYFTDGGLALELRERDAALQAMDSADRAKLLQMWSHIVHTVADKRRSQGNDVGNGEVNNDGNLPTGSDRPAVNEGDSAETIDQVANDDSTVSGPKPSVELTEILEISGNARAFMQTGGADWREKHTAAGLEKALGEARAAYNAAIEYWPTLSLVDRAIAAEEMRQLYEATTVKFLGVHSTYGAAVKDGSEIEKTLKELRVLKERFDGFAAKE